MHERNGYQKQTGVTDYTIIEKENKTARKYESWQPLLNNIIMIELH